MNTPDNIYTNDKLHTICIWINQTEILILKLVVPRPTKQSVWNMLSSILIRTFLSFKTERIAQKRYQFKNTFTFGWKELLV